MLGSALYVVYSGESFTNMELNYHAIRCKEAPHPPFISRSIWYIAISIWLSSILYTATVNFTGVAHAIDHFLNAHTTND